MDLPSGMASADYFWGGALYSSQCLKLFAAPQALRLGFGPTAGVWLHSPLVGLGGGGKPLEF